MPNDLYNDLPLTNFPSSVDQFMTFLNVVASDGSLIEQYLEAMNAGNQTQANQILAQIPQASQKLITATDLNTLSQAMLAVERFYLTDIEPYMNELQQSWTQTIKQFSYQGVWSSGTSYVVNNLVSYTVSGINLVYIATSNPPVGTVPTNSNYWRLLTIQGQQGTSGQGVSYRQEWTNSATYSVNDCVTYNAALWMAIASSQNQEPTNNSQYWQLIMNLEVTTYPIQDTEPTNLQVNGLWFNTQENPTPYYYLEPLTNPITEEMVPVGYQAYTTNGVVLDGTGPLPISSGGTGSTTPQAALSALGAGVRPNLLDNAYFVGGGSQQGGGQMPINQARQTEYNSSGSWISGIDRWQIVNSLSMILTQGYVQLQSASIKAYVRQKLPALYAEEIITASVLTDDGLFFVSGSIGASQNSSSINIGGKGSLYFENSGSNTNFVIAVNANQSINIIAAKLEKGPNQTLAYQDSTGAWHRLPQPEDGDYAGQLAKCKLYLNRLATGGGAGLTILQSYLSGSSGTVYFPVPLDCPMRPGNPTIVSYTRMDIYSPSTGAVSDAVITAVNQGNCLVFQAVKSGLSGSGFILTLNNVLVSNEL